MKQKELFYFQFIVILLLITTISCNSNDTNKECSTGDSEARIRYKDSSGYTCQSENQTRLCVNQKWGNWNGSFAHEQCSITPTVSSFDNSPFGFIVISEEFRNEFQNVSNLNGKWLRLGGIDGIIWEKIEKVKGLYDWKSFDMKIHEIPDDILSHLNLIKDNPDDRFFDIFDFHWHSQKINFTYKNHFWSPVKNLHLDILVKDIRAKLGMKT